MQVYVISMSKLIILVAKTKRSMLTNDIVEVISNVKNARRKASPEGFTLEDNGFKDQEKDTSREDKKTPKEHNQEPVSFARSQVIRLSNLL